MYTPTPFCCHNINISFYVMSGLLSDQVVLSCSVESGSFLLQLNKCKKKHSIAGDTRSTALERFSKYLFSFYPKDVIHLNAWAILWSVGAPPRLVMTRAWPGRLYLLLWWFNLWSVYTLRCNSLISIHSGSNHNPHQYIPCWTVEQQTSTDIFYIPNNHIINFEFMFFRLFFSTPISLVFSQIRYPLGFLPGRCGIAEEVCRGRAVLPGPSAESLLLVIQELPSGKRWQITMGKSPLLMGRST